MARYKKVYEKIWLDYDFLSLSAIGKLTFFYLLTAPGLNCFGVRRISILSLSEELSIKMRTLKSTLENNFFKKSIVVDHLGKLIWLRNYFKYEQIQNINVIKGWKNALDSMAECELKNTVHNHVKSLFDSLPENFKPYVPDEFKPNKDALVLEAVLDPELDTVPLFPYIPITSNLYPNKNKKIKKKDVSQARRVCPENPDVKFIFEHWQKVMNYPNAVFDPKRKSIIDKALKLGYRAKQLCDAIDGCANTPYNMGQNQNNKFYNQLGLILRDAEHIEKYMKNLESTSALSISDENMDIVKKLILKEKQCA